MLLIYSELTHKILRQFIRICLIKQKYIKTKNKIQNQENYTRGQEVKTKGKYLQATAFQIDESQTLLPRCRKEKGNNTLFSLAKGTKKMHQLFKK